MAILAPASYYFSAQCFYYLNMWKNIMAIFFFSVYWENSFMTLYVQFCILFLLQKHQFFFVATQLLVQIGIIATTIASTSRVFAMSRRHARDITGTPTQFLLRTVELQDGSTRHLAEMQIVTCIFIGRTESHHWLQASLPHLKLLIQKDKPAIFPKNTEKKDMVKLTRGEELEERKQMHA